MLHGTKLLLLLFMYSQPLAQQDSILFWDPSTSLIQIITAVTWGLYFVIEHNQNHERIIIIHKMYSERHHEQV